MTSSFFLRLALASIFALASSGTCGCSLPRSAILPANGMDGGGLRDSALADTGPVDVGPLCTPSSCDDANGCTDDSCVPATGCQHTPNADTCDDRVLCNGGDTCGGGSCSVHDDEDPCLGASTCDVASDTCVGCEGPSDCPGAMTGDWSPCDFSAGDTCATTGSRSRGITTYDCVASVCEPTTMPETGVCTRPTEGDPCGPPTTGAWSACVFSDMCAEIGTMSRSVTTSSCVAEACTPAATTETVACTRVTEATVCGTVTMGGYGPCETVGTSCSTSGVETQMVTTPYCVSGTCTPIVSTETRACTLSSTDGAECGTPTCGAFGACTPITANTCETVGMRTQSCTTATCSGGTCSGASPTTNTERCVVPAGAACTTPLVCGACVEDTMTRCRSSQMGHRPCSSTSGTCTSGGACVGTLVTTSEVCNCP